MLYFLHMSNPDSGINPAEQLISEKEQKHREKMCRIMNDYNSRDLMVILSTAHSMGEKAMAEFVKLPETQRAAVDLMISHFEARRASAALQIMTMFDLPEHLVRSEEMQQKMEPIVLTIMSGGDSTGAFDIINRFDLSTRFVRSDEMKQAALACRNVLATRVSPSVVARRIQLEKDFDLPPLESKDSP